MIITIIITIPIIIINTYIIFVVLFSVCLQPPSAYLHFHFQVGFESLLGSSYVRSPRGSNPWSAKASGVLCELQTDTTVNLVACLIKKIQIFIWLIPGNTLIALVDRRIIVSYSVADNTHLKKRLSLLWTERALALWRSTLSFRFWFRWKKTCIMVSTFLSLNAWSNNIKFCYSINFHAAFLWKKGIRNRSDFGTTSISALFDRLQIYFIRFTHH